MSVTWGPFLKCPLRDWGELSRYTQVGISTGLGVGWGCWHWGQLMEDRQWLCKNLLLHCLNECLIMQFASILHEHHWHFLTFLKLMLVCSLWTARFAATLPASQENCIALECPWEETSWIALPWQLPEARRGCISVLLLRKIGWSRIFECVLNFFEWA